MADKTDPAPAEDQPAVEAPVADAPAPESRADTIAALIRNGLSNSPISQSETTWQALETRLPEIVAAIMEA